MLQTKDIDSFRWCWSWYRMFFLVLWQLHM